MRKYNTKMYPGIMSHIWRRILWLAEYIGNRIIDGFRYGFVKLNQKKSYALKGSRDDIVIIANGPSVNDSMADIMKHKNCDYACMNFFPIKSSYFETLKPRFMFAADVMFFDKDYKNAERREDTMLLKNKLEAVDWDMKLFLRQGGSFELSNDHVQELRVSTTQIDGGYSKFRRRLFDRGAAMPLNATVASMAILYCIKMGYKNIYVYGIDQSQHENVWVDENNHTVHNCRHFYKAKEDYDYDVAQLYYDAYRSIKGFRTLECYAQDKGCKVYNCTPKSYVDAFKRYSIKDDEE